MHQSLHKPTLPKGLLSTPSNPAHIQQPLLPPFSPCECLFPSHPPLVTDNALVIWVNSFISLVHPMVRCSLLVVPLFPPVTLLLVVRLPTGPNANSSHPFTVPCCQISMFGFSHSFTSRQPTPLDIITAHHFVAHHPVLSGFDTWSFVHSPSCLDNGFPQ